MTSQEAAKRHLNPERVDSDSRPTSTTQRREHQSATKARPRPSVAGWGHIRLRDASRAVTAIPSHARGGGLTPVAKRSETSVPRAVRAQNDAHKLDYTPRSKPTSCAHRPPAHRDRDMCTTSRMTSRARRCSASRNSLRPPRPLAGHYSASPGQRKREHLQTPAVVNARACLRKLGEAYDGYREPALAELSHDTHPSAWLRRSVPRCPRNAVPVGLPNTTR